MIKKPKLARRAFKLLTGMVIGSAVGSILGLTLAPKKGKETRKAIKDASMRAFLEGKRVVNSDQKIGFFKKLVVKLLTRNK